MNSQLVGILAFICLIWLLKSCLSAQETIANHSVITEGFAEGMLSKNNVGSVESRAKALDSEADTIINGMLINEGSNRRNFEKLLLALDKWCDAVILSELADNTIEGAKPYDDKTQSKITQINNITKLKKSINNSVAFLDKQ